MTEVLVACGAALALLGHGLLWMSAINRLHGTAWPHRLVDGLTLLGVAALAALPVAALWQSLAADGAAGLFDFAAWQGWYAAGCAALGGSALVVKPWIEWARHDRSVLDQWTTERRDPAARRDGSLLVGRKAQLLAWWPGNESTALSIDRKRLAIPRLPAALEGLTIVHLSDLHMTGQIAASYYAHLADEVNALRPDVVAITGDIVEHRACWPWLGESLGRLCAPLGVYYILGNHDAYVDAAHTRSLLAEAGLVGLSGRWARAEWNGVRVTLGGNELPWLGPAAPLESLAPRGQQPGDDAEFRLVLSHSPDQFRWCCRADADLALAGHTHGGQVRLPWLGVVASPSLYGVRYASGVFRRGATVMHVSRGIGGETPLRWRCTPEAALLELVRGRS